MTSYRSELSRFLNRLLRRSVLDYEERNAILSLSGRVEQFRPNFDIVSPGNTVDHSCLIGRGLAARYDQMANGQRQLNAFHIEGDMCDLHSLVCPTAAWGITAMTTTTVLQVPHVELRNIIASYPAVALAFWRDGTADASILAKWIGNLGRRDARARVAHLLCEMALRTEAAGIGSREHFWFAVTQNNLADAVGLTPVHVNRTMQVLRRERLIRSSSHYVYIDSWSRLVDVADFDADYLLLDCNRVRGPNKLVAGAAAHSSQPLAIDRETAGGFT